MVMKKLVTGIKSFQQQSYPENKSLFRKLRDGQNPETLFITCSDSRSDPSLLTQTKPGDLFILRNAGNIVPPYGASNGGEAAAVEYAITALGVENIIVCGHSHCGAMQGLLNPDSLSELPAVAEWLKHAASTRRVVQDIHKNKTGADLHAAAIQENTIAQISNLKTHPSVAAALAEQKIKLHAWVYEFENGKVFEWNSQTNLFTDLCE